MSQNQPVKHSLSPFLVSSLYGKWERLPITFIQNLASFNRPCSNRSARSQNCSTSWRCEITINATGSWRNRWLRLFAAAASKFAKGSSNTKIFRCAKSARAKPIFVIHRPKHWLLSGHEAAWRVLLAIAGQMSVNQSGLTLPIVPSGLHCGQARCFAATYHQTKPPLGVQSRWCAQVGVMFQECPALLERCPLAVIKAPR